MRKHLTYILSAFALVAVSCSETPYGGYDPGLDKDDRDLYVPNAIQISIGDPSYTSITRTRGGGAFDSRREDIFMKELWENARIGVFSFPKENANLSAISVNDSAACLIDATTKKPELANSKAGRKAIMNYGSGNFIMWEDGEDLYYNAAQPKRRYDFFGYYYDDAIVDEDNISRTPNEIKIPIEIDGSQDVMGGYAELDSTQRRSINAYVNRDSVLASYYSNYTGRSDNNVFPILNFKHYLTRLKFRIYPNDSISQYVFVDSISVESNYRGTMTLASTNKTDLGLSIVKADRKELFLQDFDRKPIKADYYNIPLISEEKDLPYYKRTGRQVGESLLLPPESHYKVTLYMHQTWPKEIFYKNSYEISNNNYIFKPGYEYTLRILIAGNHPIDPVVELTGWAQGSNIILDLEESNSVLN